VLVAAAIVSAALWALGLGHEEAGEPFPYDALVILTIVALNAVLGFVQEYRAERAVEALREMAAPESRVRRDGDERDVPSSELVPGDVLVLEAGDRVAADARLIDGHNLKVDEAALTGESVPVAKRVDTLGDPKTELGDRSSMVYTGTAITYGRGEALVVATGMGTEMGAIASMLQTATEEATPLEVELARVGRQLGVLVLAICAVVAVAGLIEEGTLSTSVFIDMFLFGVALAVAAIPEGLPAVVTAVLALGVRRMAAAQAVVRRLPAVETLGSATVICSDKTGTVTTNEMAVRRLLLGSDRLLEVEGGVLRDDPGDGQARSVSPEESPGLRRLLLFACLNNDAEPAHPGTARGIGPGDQAEKDQPEGDPTEVGLLVAAADAGLDPARLRQEHPRLDEIPFSSERKRMTTLHALPFEVAPGEGAAGDQGLTAIVKGAPEVVLELCTHVRTAGDGAEPLDEETRRAILRRNEELAQAALRTLAFASRRLAAASPEELPQDDSGEADADAVERELVWEGLAGMMDPPRPGAAAAVAQARRAGIRSILITGDHALTGLAIAREVGIAGAGDRALRGPEVERMSDDELRRQVVEVPVFGRVRPEHKLRIVRALKELGEVVAMTGDGVNDAPALKEADIGVAMGITGTDVAKEAADMVLTDDDYSTIVEAVAEGRRIFDNIRKFIRYLLSSNAGEVLTMFAGILGAGVLGLGTGGTGTAEEGSFFLPLLAVQILWINLVTDGAPALALGIDPGSSDLMEQPARRPGEPVIDRPMWWTIGLVGIVMMAGTLFVLDAYLPGGLVAPLGFLGAGGANIAHARTAAFTTLVMFQMANVFNCLSARESLFTAGPFRNPWLLLAVTLSIGLHALVVYWPPLQTAFETTALSAADWAVAIGVALTVIVAGELSKLVLRFDRSRGAA